MVAAQTGADLPVVEIKADAQPDAPKIGLEDGCLDAGGDAMIQLGVRGKILAVDADDFALAPDQNGTVELPSVLADQEWTDDIQPMPARSLRKRGHRRPVQRLDRAPWIGPVQTVADLREGDQVALLLRRFSDVRAHALQRFL